MRKTKPVVWILGSWLLLLLGGCSGGILDPKGHRGSQKSDFDCNRINADCGHSGHHYDILFCLEISAQSSDADKDYEPIGRIVIKSKW